MAAAALNRRHAKETGKTLRSCTDNVQAMSAGVMPSC